MKLLWIDSQYTLQNETKKKKSVKNLTCWIFMTFPIYMLFSDRKFLKQFDSENKLVT